MLLMQRRVGQRIVLSGGIEITVISSSRGSVRLGIEAPRGIQVIRGETYDRIAQANAMAAESIGPDTTESSDLAEGEPHDE